MIELQNITKSFGPQKVLDQLSLRIPEGQITVIIGRSGEGKSVLLKHMMGLLRPDAGHVIVEGVDLSKLNDYQLNETRKMFGMLFQQAALFDSMTVFENIAFPLVEHTKKPFLEVTKDVSALAAMVGLSRLALSKFPSELSGGMRKRVGLARAIALKPKILLYDEPTTGLDPIMADKINVLIADDHAIVRQGLKQILSETEDLLVTGEAGDGAEALILARQQVWDVFLLDVSMPNRNGIDTLKQLKKEKPKLAVLMLSMHLEETYALRAIKAGASGYLNKQSAPGLLITAIRQVASGRRYISPAVAEALAGTIADGPDRTPHAALSDREYETMRLIASGRTLTEIAAEMHLSVKTVSVYRARLLEKMQLKNNSELTHYALKNQLVE